MEEKVLERLIEEKDQLSDRCNKLSAFLDSKDKLIGLDVTQINLLMVQLKVMESYLLILQRRINLILPSDCAG